MSGTQRGTWVSVPVRSIRIMLPSARRSVMMAKRSVVMARRCVVMVLSYNGIMGSSGVGRKMVHYMTHLERLVSVRISWLHIGHHLFAPYLLFFLMDFSQV